MTQNHVKKKRWLRRYVKIFEKSLLNMALQYLRHVWKFLGFSHWRKIQTLCYFTSSWCVDKEKHIKSIDNFQTFYPLKNAICVILVAYLPHEGNGRNLVMFEKVLFWWFLLKENFSSNTEFFDFNPFSVLSILWINIYQSFRFSLSNPIN